MRLGEVLGLRWQDVDFENHTVTINQTSGHDDKIKKQQNKFFKAYNTRSYRNNRSLKKHRITINKEKLRFGAAYQDQDLINCNEFGNVFRKDSFRRQFIKIIKTQV